MLTNETLKGGIMRRLLARIVIFVFRLFRVQCFAEMETPGG
jgi:hypothetical protein